MPQDAAPNLSPLCGTPGSLRVLPPSAAPLYPSLGLPPGSFCSFCSSWAAVPLL